MYSGGVTTVAKTVNIRFDKNGYDRITDTYKSCYYACKAFDSETHNKGSNIYDTDLRPIFKKMDDGTVKIVGETLERAYEK